MELREASAAPAAPEDQTPKDEPVVAQDATSDVVNPAPEAKPEEPKAEETPSAEAPAEPVAEESKAEEPAPAEEPKAEEPSLPFIQTKEEVVAALRDISAKEAGDISADDMARLKHLFYNFRNAEIRAEKEAFVTAGGAEEEFVATADPVEEQFKELLNVVKEKKNEARTALEAERAANLEKKRAIIATITELAADADNVNRHFPRVRDLQNEFKAVGEVPPTDQATIWKKYQDAVEIFYDQWKINKELRDYDFRKNLELKQALVEEAAKLAEEADIIAAFRALQGLHDKWREIGPVAKEVREEIWAKFKEASAVINKRYQTHFEERKEQEKANEEAKTAICERVEALDFSTLKTFADWDAMTRVILEAQADWKKLGFASKKMNNALFARFRGVCDTFFAAKAEYFKAVKEELAENYRRKTALCEKAEALKESTEWRKTTDAMVKLQQEWKSIGSVPKKNSEALWRRFMDACDHFFEQKKSATSGARRTEQANLKLKQQIIDALKATPMDASRDDVLQSIRDSRTRWQEVGHVPFKEKDKIYDTFRQAINELYDKFDIRAERARMAAFENNVKAMDGDQAKIARERDHLARIAESRRADLQTYSNNLGFLSSKSKSGDSMVREMERRMERLRDEIADLEKRIKILDEKL